MDHGGARRSYPNFLIHETLPVWVHTWPMTRYHSGYTLGVPVNMCLQSHHFRIPVTRHEQSRFMATNMAPCPQKQKLRSSLSVSNRCQCGMHTHGEQEDFQKNKKGNVLMGFKEQLALHHQHHHRRCFLSHYHQL